MGDLLEPLAFDDRDNEPPYPAATTFPLCTEPCVHLWVYAGAFLASHCYCAYCGADGADDEFN